MTRRKATAKSASSKERAMRDSMIAEVGMILAHWKTRKQRYAYQDVRSGNWGSEPEGGPNDVPCLRVGDFDRETLRLKHQERALRASPYDPPQSRNIQAPSLLLERAGGSEKVPVGKVVLYDRDEQAIASNFIVELRPEPRSDARYLLFQHLDLYLTGRVRRSASHTSGIQNLDVRAYLDEPVAWPPYEEQQRLGEELDALHQDYRKRTNLWKRPLLLLEKRRLILSQKMFRQKLTPEQPAGEAWPTRRLSSLVDVSAGAIFPAESIGDSGVPLVRLGDLRCGILDVTSCARIDAELVPDNAWAYHGDVLVSLSSRIGMYTLVQGDPVAVNQRVAVLRPKNGADAYLHAFLRSTEFQLQLHYRADVTGTMANLAMSELRNLRVPWPSEAERDEIARILDVEDERHRRLIPLIHRAIDLQDARFCTLVNALVHGRLQNGGAEQDK